MLVGHWPLHEVGSATIRDVRGVNKGTWEPSGTPSQASAPRTMGYVFNGVDEYVDIGVTNLNIKSVALLIKQDNVAGNEFPITPNLSSYLLVNQGVVTLVGFTAPLLYVNGILGTSGSTTILADTWNLIVITDTTALDANNMAIGKVTASYFAGCISDVRIYDHVLSPSKVRDLYEKLFGLTRGRREKVYRCLR